MSLETTVSMSLPHCCNRPISRAVVVSVPHLCLIETKRMNLEFDSTLAKMHSRRSSPGPNNPTSWMDNLNSNMSLEIQPRKGRGASTLRNAGNALTLNKKTSPSTNFTSGSIKGV